MARRHTFPALLGATALGAAVAVGPLPGTAGAAPGDDPVLDRALTFIAASQQEDGSFELGGFEGFETLDAVLAIGLGATPGTLDPAEGRARVEAVATDDGRTGFDAIDDEVEAAAGADGVAAGRAAKVAVLTALPFDFDLAAFDPAGDGTPVDLLTAIEDGEEGGAYGFFTDTLYAVLALTGAGRPVGDDTIALIRGAQQANGGWDFAGDAAGEEVDVDLTSLAIQALVATGADAGDEAVAGGLALLGRSTLPGGGWGDDTGVNPNSTALAVLAVSAAGFDAAERCWQDLSAPETTGARFTSPLAVLRSLQAEDGHITSPFDSFGVTTFATSQSVQALSRGWLPMAVAPPVPCDGPAYVTVTAGGELIRFAGGEPALVLEGQARNAPVIGAADLPGGTGSWLFAADGGVFPTGDAGFFGSAGSLPLQQPVVGGAAAPDGQGYWLVAADGGVFSYGSARFHGSMGGRHLNQPVVGMAAAPDGEGYHLVAADGGIFSFGSAAFAGSTGGLRLNRPVVGMDADPDGTGYWLVASDGGIFAFDAAFSGSLGATPLDEPIVDMVHAAGGAGYLLAGGDGGVFAFGAAPFLGSAAGLADERTVAILPG